MTGLGECCCVQGDDDDDGPIDGGFCLCETSPSGALRFDWAWRTSYARSDQDLSQGFCASVNSEGGGTFECFGAARYCLPGYANCPGGNDGGKFNPIEVIYVSARGETNDTCYFNCPATNNCHGAPCFSSCPCYANTEFESEYRLTDPPDPCGFGYGPAMGVGLGPVPQGGGIDCEGDFPPVQYDGNVHCCIPRDERLDPEQCWLAFQWFPRFGHYYGISRRTSDCAGNPGQGNEEVLGLPAYPAYGTGMNIKTYTRIDRDGGNCVIGNTYLHAEPNVIDGQLTQWSPTPNRLARCNATSGVFSFQRQDGPTTDPIHPCKVRFGIEQATVQYDFSYSVSWD